MVSNEDIKKDLAKKRNNKSKKYCPKCGKENTSNADYCAECGSKLDVTPVQTDKTSEGWWSSRSRNEKILAGFSTCCIGIFLILLLAAFMAPEITSLNVSNDNINENITEYSIKGVSEANATVNITCSQLNITNVKAQVDKDGNFVYKIKIPQEITDIKVKVSAIAPGKTENSEEIAIQRPTTELYLDDVPTISEKNKSVTIAGSTDPNANVTVNSKALNITDVKIKADSEGKFSYKIEVPQTVDSAKIQISVKVLGKKQKSDSISITRIISEPESSTSESNTTSSESTESSSDSSGSGSYVGSVNSNKFHYLYCASAKMIHSENTIYFGSRKEALDAGYVPCKRCNP